MRSLAPLPASVETAIRRHCESAYPHEACGFLLGPEPGMSAPCVVVEAVEAPNEHDGDHARRYEIAPEAQLAVARHAEARGLEVVGYYHSHPDHPAVPSDYDREHAWPGYVYLICAVEAGAMARLGAYALDEATRRFERLEAGVGSVASLQEATR